MPKSMYIRTGNPPSFPDEREWTHAARTWVSLSKVRLDGGFVFRSQTVPIEPLFVERWEEVPRLVLDGATFYVISGEITVIRTMLDGKPGFEGLVLPA